MDNQVVDSTQVVGNHFGFKGKLAESFLYLIQVDTASRRYPVFLENSAIRMKHCGKWSYQVTGSKLHTQWQAYNTTFLDPVRQELIRLYSERSEALKQGDSLRFKTLMKQNDSVSIYYGTHVKDHIAQKPYTFLNLFLLKSTGFSDEYKANMLTEFKNELGQYPSFKQLEQDLTKKALQQAKVSPGAVAYGFNLPDSSGKLHSLASRHKKVILLDFWASWCGPCIAQFPALKALDAQYRDKGLEIIGISIDDDRKRFVLRLPATRLPSIHCVS
jgi:thiol-disulfide isomerase/thioredoxin